MFYLGLSCVVTGSLGTLGAGAWVWASGRDWALASLISMVGGVDNVDNTSNNIQVGMVQMYLVTWAVQLESATRVTMVRQLDIVLAYVVQVTVTPPRPSPASPLPCPGGGVRPGAGLGGGPGQPPGHPHRGLHPAAELQPPASR